METRENALPASNCEIILAKNISIELGEPIVLEDSLRAAMEKEWARALERNPEVFDGEILLLKGWKRDAEGTLRLSVAWGTYKMFVASRALPLMREIVRPLGVSGMMLCHGEEQNGTISPASAVVFARRSGTVATYPNCWELMPSGSISRDSASVNHNTIDYICQILEEFEQETGFNAQIIQQITPTALIFDKQANIYDICVRLNLSVSQTVVMEQFQGNDEYTEMRCVSLLDIPHFLQHHASDIVPPSKVLAEMLCTMVSEAA
ncbi:MAG: hypothetical protein EAZ92_07595 [Candidatus Kapaibacterium sp.]|nr:MAG: hypothetical protein EAZ92_07595 [Candidatus Kapabacteria bacterium]